MRSGAAEPDAPVLVRGVGEIGSAVAHALLRRGVPAAIQEDRDPLTSRRRMAFADAVFDGRARLDGVEARLVEPDGLAQALRHGGHVPVLRAPLDQAMGLAGWTVLVDARMVKHAASESSLGLAPLTVALGPGHEAGTTADWVVETAWGSDLGRVMTAGATLPLTGEPRAIAGGGRERFVYAPAAGTFRTARRIGELVEAGAPVAEIDGAVLRAPLAGAIRGLVRDGVAVPARTKVIEIDPRGPAAQVEGLGERPRRIGESVAEAVQAHLSRTRG